MDAHATDIIWHPARKFLFRFLFTYFFLYSFPFPFDSFDFTKPVALPFYNFLDWLIPQIGSKWFHIRASTAFPLFDRVDDSGYGIVFIYFNLIISAVAACTWSFADRKRKNYQKLNQWLRLYLRYFLAAYLFGYGFVKVFPSQFQAITASRLAMTVGDQSPMLMAWNFMGYSTVMMKLNGLAEVLAGLLLLFRHTTTIGAILSSCVFSFVVMMDFVFNVPVRLLASHLLIISLFLILEDRRKLLNIFLLNKPAFATIYKPFIIHRGWRKVFSGLLGLLAVCILFSTITNSISSEKESGQKAPPVPLYGVYNTSYFLRNNDTVPPLQTDSLRWKQLVIDGGSWKQSGTIQFNSDNRAFFDIKTDTVNKTIGIISQSDTAEKYLLHYFINDNSHLRIKGLWKNDSIEIFLNKYDLNNYLLHKEKFKWIEY